MLLSMMGMVLLAAALFACGTVGCLALMADAEDGEVATAVVTRAPGH
ncbi:MAG: hypothetical protein JWP97_2187 [Labilithrix sp.]|nr:hypothetical protein [Labilithrix sp.]